MPPFVENGVPITADMVWNPEGPAGFQCYRVSADGARRVEFILFNPEEPEISDYFLPVSANSPVTPAHVGMIPFDSILRRNTIGARNISDGAYIAYDFSADPYRDHPVNQVPYVVRWREHLSTVAHDFTAQPLTDLFALLHRDDGVAPVDVAHSVIERQTFEFVSRIVRTLVGLLWNRLPVYAALDPVATVPTWKAQTHLLQDLVDKLCVSCSGRGWKQELVKNLRTWTWGTRFGIEPDAVHFPVKGPDGYWSPGSDFPEITAVERKEWLAGWNDALDYHHATDGSEADDYLDEPLPTV